MLDFLAENIRDKGLEERIKGSIIKTVHEKLSGNSVVDVRLGYVFEIIIGSPYCGGAHQTINYAQTRNLEGNKDLIRVECYPENISYFTEIITSVLGWISKGYKSKGKINVYQNKTSAFQNF